MQEILEDIRRRDQPVGPPVRAKRGHSLLWAIGLALAYTLRTLLRAVGLAIAHTLRWALGPGRLRRAVILYFVIGLGLLAIGFVQPRGCPSPNTDIISNLDFVVTWPVGFYRGVYSGFYGTVGNWTHQHACYGNAGGLLFYR